MNIIKVLESLETSD